jgi:WD40 repeat protein
MAGMVGCDGRTAPSDAWDVAAQGIYTAALSDDSTLSVVGSLNHGGSLWRTTDRERLFDWNHRAGEYSDLVATAFSPDGHRAVTTDPRTLVLWDTDSGAALGFWTTPSAVLAVALAADGRTVLMGLKDHSAILFDAISGAYLHTFLHDGEVVSVDLSRDGRLAITGSDDGTAVLWDVANGTARHRLTLDNPARVVALSAGGRFAFTAAQNRAVTVWDATAGTPLFDLEARNTGILSARFSPDESELLLGYVNRTVALWDLGSRSRRASWRTQGRNPWRENGAAVLAVGFGAQSGTYFAVAGDGRLLTLRPG